MTVSRLRSFTRAAEQLHVSQPSITNAIHNLEQELGMPLLERNKRKVELNKEGQFFLERVSKILNLVEETVSEMHDLKSPSLSTIHLGVPSMISVLLFPDIFRNFNKAYPQIEIEVKEEGSRAIRQYLENGELDLGIIILPENTNALETLPIFKEQVVIGLAKNHPLSHQSCVSFRDLEKEPFILLKDDTAIRHAVLSRCQMYNFSPEIILSSNQIETIKGLVASGMGISFFMSRIAQGDEHFISLPLAEPIDFQIGLAWQKNKYIPRSVKTFINFVANYIKSHEFTRA